MTSKHFRIERAVSADELTEFWLFANDVYADRPVHWTTTSDDLNPMLKGDGPPPPVAVLRRSWRGRTGRSSLVPPLLLTSATSSTGARPSATLPCSRLSPARLRQSAPLMDEACAWLRGQGLEAARAGFSSLNDWPYTVDAYELLPPPGLRQNPAYYHALLKEARFVPEKGWVDYKIEVTPQLVERWQQMLRAAKGAGFSILSFAESDEDRRISDFNMVWNAAFVRYWGGAPRLRGRMATGLRRHRGSRGT